MRGGYTPWSERAQDRLEQELQPFTGFSDDLRQRGISVSSRILSAEIVETTDALAAQLELSALTPAFRLERLRIASGRPLAIQCTWLPAHLCPGLMQFDFTTCSLYDVLRQEYGLRLFRGETVIKASIATSKERQLLMAGEPSAVLRTFQTTYLDDDRPIEYCQSIFHGDLYELTTTTGI
jgi:GntR family transcriptional regulator